jgi:hypothetical protein
MKVLVDASCNILYSSFYLKGIKDLGYHLVFSNTPFKCLNHDFQFLGLQFIEESTATRNVIIDFSNHKNIDTHALEWCDVYGKVNLHEEDLLIDKVIPIGPLTAINLYSPIKAFFIMSFNFLKSHKRISKVRAYASYYKAITNREKLEKLPMSKSESNFIFFASSLWEKEKAYNEMRFSFITAVKKMKGISFEGGFAPRTKNDIKGFEGNTLKERIPYHEFYSNLTKSMLAFHTPSVGDCNGWRLAEYLYMGKAILSTPLKRVMPESFKNGVHFLETDGTPKDIEAKITNLKSDTYRKVLEQNALEYYQTVLAPEIVIKKLLKT